MTPLIVFLLCNFIFPTSQFDFGKLEVVSDLTPEACFADQKMYMEAYDDDGLPRCVDYEEPDEADCVTFRNHELVDHETTPLISKPTCTKDGQYAAVQCKGERNTGRCFCYDGQGKRIFGQQWWRDAHDMTCACSRRKAELKSKENIYFNSLHCNSMGNYEPLQCDVISEQCWCVDEKTGDLTSPVVPQKAMVKLPCYQSLTLGTQYLRQCESQKYAESRILNQLKLRGTMQASFAELLCDDDGSYGAYTVVDGSAYCTWKDKSYLGTWQYSGSDRRSVNCNCARDSKIYQNAGKSQTQTCGGNGNYQSYQVSGGVAYCVDMDGFKKTIDGVTLEKEEDCNKYPEYPTILISDINIT